MSWNPFKGADAQTGNTGSGNTGAWMNIETSQVRAAATGDLTGEPSAFEALGFKFSRQERLIGFISCTGIGFVLSIIGAIMLFIGITSLFAILYSVGIVVSLVGTGFLIGFLKQMRQMFKPVRVVATGIMVAAFVLVWCVRTEGNIAIDLTYTPGRLDTLPVADMVVHPFPLLWLSQDLRIRDWECCAQPHICHCPVPGVSLGESCGS